MKVLIIGGGGREHALAWKVASDPGVDSVLAAPGSAGIAQIAECADVGVGDLDGLARLARDACVDLTLVGPEAPLAAGLADRFRADGLRVFGPGAAGAKLEASKAFTKKVLVDAGVPTAAYGEFDDARAARAFARELGAPLVVKADGLAAGKGVIICETLDEADAAIDGMLEKGSFGEAGARVVVEEFLRGEEASFIALTDGRDAVALAPSQDHKAVFDGDRGPNTGGMGAYSPAPVVTDALAEDIMRTVIEPTIGQLRSQGIDYRGVLYAGLMIDGTAAKVLEYNVRFGDPECQPLMLRLESSLVELIDACIDGNLGDCAATWHPGSAACVVMASGGYPGSHETGKVITGIDEACSDADVEVFHAGTRRDGDRWLTAGGRVLGVTARGDSIETALERAYGGVARIGFDGAHHRKDIGHRALTG